MLVSLILLSTAVGILEPSRALLPTVGSAPVAWSGVTASSPSRTSAGSAVAGTFYQNQTQIATFGNGNASEYCLSGLPATCYPNSANPSVLGLRNGKIGLIYEETTTSPGYACAGSAGGGTMSRIGFSLSSDGGRTFSATSLIGDQSSSTCPYFQQIEPAFTVQSNGTIDGVYVGANESGSTFQGYSSPLTLGYTSRSSDALVFVQSFDNGSSFSNGTVLLPTVVGTANLSRPAVASFGHTIYVAFENISNGTSFLPGTSSLPTSVELVVSTDGGTSWTGPFVLPGENSTEFNATFSPSLAVSSNGTLAVSYVTNRQCVAFCSTFLPAYGEDVVSVTSATNGSSFSRPHRIATVGEPAVFGIGGLIGPAMSQIFQYAPSTSTAWDLSSGNLYVAYSGAQNLSIEGGVPFPILVVFDDWADEAVWVANSADGGQNWSTVELGGVPGPHTWAEVGSGVPVYFNPGIADRNGTAVVTFTEKTDSPPATECGLGSPSDFGSAFSQLVAFSPDGLAWSDRVIVDAEPRSEGLAFYNYPGYSSSVGFAPDGEPVLAYSIDTAFQFGGPGTVYDAWNVSVAIPYSGPTLNVSFSTSGLAAGSTWSFDLDGAAFSTNSSNLTVANVPRAKPVFIASETPTEPVGYEVVRGVEGGSRWASFSASSDWKFTFTTFVAFMLIPQPGNVPSAEFAVGGAFDNLDYDFFHDWTTQSFFGTTYYYQTGCSLPWYLPSGLNFTFKPPADFETGNVATYRTPMYISYWTGTSRGGYTGAGPEVPIAIADAMVNETFWMVGGGSYGVDFAAPTLPPTTPFSFTFNGSARQGFGGRAVLVPNVTEGPHLVTNVSATSPLPGWQYFGFPQGGNPISVPQSPTVNLTFAEENLTAPTGPVDFHATGLTNGTPWQFEFNGTVYGSSSPWLNLTAHPGDYPVAGFPVTSLNGSATYVPFGLGREVNITDGNPVNLSFRPAYELTVLENAGGTVGGAGTTQWGLPGTSFNLSAQPRAGYGFGGWTGTGAGSYTGARAAIEVTLHGPVVESATFYPLPTNRFNLSFVGSGIPAGTTWTVYVNGRGYATSTSSLTVPGLFGCGSPTGTYQILIPFAYAVNSANATRYVPVSYASSGCGGQTISVVFDPQYYVTVESTAGGTVAGSSGWYGPFEPINLRATAETGYSFAGWQGNGPGNYTGPSATEVVTGIAGPVTEVAGFVSLTLRFSYTVTFTASVPLPSSAQWSVDVGNTTYEGGGGSVSVPGLAYGTHSFIVRNGTALEGSARLIPLDTEFTIDVTLNLTQPVPFEVQFWVSLQVAGPGSIAGTSGWQANGSTLVLNASAPPGAIFVNWTGSGAGSYSGDSADASVVIRGPIVEVAAFAPTATAPAAPPSAPALIEGVLALIAGAGAVVGFLVGILVPKWRRRSPSGRKLADGESVPVEDSQSPAREGR